MKDDDGNAPIGVCPLVREVEIRFEPAYREKPWRYSRWVKWKSTFWGVLGVLWLAWLSLWERD